MEHPNLTPSAEAITEYRERQAEIGGIADIDQRAEANMALQAALRRLVTEYSKGFLRNLVGDPSDGTEALVWFWFNHFNLFGRQGVVGAGLPSYIDEVIRPNVSGRFKDLLLGTMTHPGILVYLDNFHNASGKMNENYARELLELHTLGVDGGYGEADVRETARLLTGFGLRPLGPVQWTPKQVANLVERGEFLFDPRRHDFGDKVILGQPIQGNGFAEIETLAELLARHPATARHLAGKLCLFLVGEKAPAALVGEAARVFRETDGDLAAVASLIRATATDLGPARTKTFKDPLRWVVSAVGLLAAGLPIRDATLPLGWLQALGQPLFGCHTPDGYSLRGSVWLNSGQMAQRFELAPHILDMLPRVVERALPWQQILASPAAAAQVARLGPRSKQGFAKAKGDLARLALLMTSPDFMYW